MLKITFKEPTLITQDGIQSEALFTIANKVHIGKVGALIDDMPILTEKIETIESYSYGK